MSNSIKKSGYVAMIGKPNVGKSTLMNYILGKKLSITSRKPQTTRHRILGVKTQNDTQVVYLDTPGIHQNHKRLMNKVMNRAALGVLEEVDIILFLVDALKWGEDDAAVLKQLKSLSIPIILVVNKIDQVKDKALLLPFLEKISALYDFVKVFPISAKTGLQVDALENEIHQLLPSDIPFFPPEQFTDRSNKFVATEFIREKLMRSLGEELPYETAVTIEAFEEDESIIRIAALIFVNRDSQKAIVIGKAGSVLKSVGTQARLDLENYFEKKVLLKLWVKVKSGWSDDQRSLQDFGYDEH